MKKIISLTILTIFTLSSCYVYRPFNPELEVKKNNNNVNSFDVRSSSSISLAKLRTDDGSEEEAKGIKKNEITNSKESVKNKKNEKETEALSRFSGLSKEDSIKKVIEPYKFYKIRVNDKMYKIQAQQWEADSLVSHIKDKPKKIVKVHKNQIEEVLPRRFSKIGSDGFSITAYIAAAVALIFLL